MKKVTPEQVSDKSAASSRRDLRASIEAGKHVFAEKPVRMSAYTGQSLTWDQILNSQQDLSPADDNWDAAPPPAEVAVPGMTKFV